MTRKDGNIFLPKGSLGCNVLSDGCQTQRWYKAVEHTGVCSPSTIERPGQ